MPCERAEGVTSGNHAVDCPLRLIEPIAMSHSETGSDIHWGANCDTSMPRAVRPSASKHPFC